MNKECKTLKSQLNVARQKYQESIRLNKSEQMKSDLRDTYFSKKKIYQKNVKHLKNPIGIN